VQFDLAAFYTLRDGRITQIREIIDTFDLVQQALERDVAAVLAEAKPGNIWAPPGINQCANFIFRRTEPRCHCPRPIKCLADTGTKKPQP
jgi:hypothetical protein